MSPEHGNISGLMDRASSGDGGTFAKPPLASQDQLPRFALARGLTWAAAAMSCAEGTIKAAFARGAGGPTGETPARQAGRHEASMTDLHENETPPERGDQVMEELAGLIDSARYSGCVRTTPCRWIRRAASPLPAGAAAAIASADHSNGR